MIYIGFAVSFLVLFVATVLIVCSAIYCLGKYNIGGVPHTWKDRLWIPFAVAALVWLWPILLESSPFIIQVK